MRELLGRLDARELAEEMAYAEIEPYGPLDDMLRAGVLAAAIVNPQRRRGARALTPADFFPALRPEEAEASAEDVIALLGMATRQGAGETGRGPSPQISNRRIGE